MGVKCYLVELAVRIKDDVGKKYSACRKWSIT